MRVKVLVSTVRYGTNGFKHKGDEYSLPEDQAKAKADLGLVKIIGETAAAAAAKTTSK